MKTRERIERQHQLPASLISESRHDPRPRPEEAKNIVEKLRDVLEGRVKAAFLFGGVAGGYVLKGDIDIAVFFGRPYDMYELGALVVDIADALGVDEELIDLLVLDGAPPELVLEALDGLPILPGEPALVFELRSAAMREHLDLVEGMSRACAWGDGEDEPY